MSFPAKFGGTCSKCGARIPAGEKVNYDGHQIRHAPRCPAKGTVTETAVSASEPRTPETVTDSTKVVGRATYKGKPGYLVLWMGTTSRGEAVKLAFRDGSKVFWADRANVQIDKRYDENGYYGPMTFGRIKQFVAKMKDTPAEERGKCESCGRWNGNHTSDCDMQFGGMSGYNERGHFILGADD